MSGLNIKKFNKLIFNLFHIIPVPNFKLCQMLALSICSCRSYFWDIMVLPMLGPYHNVMWPISNYMIISRKFTVELQQKAARN